MVESTHEALATTPGMRQVLLGRGGRSRARSAGAYSVAIDVDAMTRAAFVGSVAMAAGRQPVPSRGPVAAVAKPAQQPGAPTIAAARAAGKLILVAEDDSVNQKVILRQLAMLGHAAEVADDGAQALLLWRQGGHALLLSDLHMPTMDGYTLAQSIRAEEPAGRRLPILALTANALKGEASRARACGMDDYLTKPIQLKVLKAALETHMNANHLPATLPPHETAVATVAAVAASASVDLSVLTALLGDDSEVVNEFVSDYLASVRRLAPEMSAACDAGDLPKITTIAHKLKSSSRSIGALALGDLCAELENVGRSGMRDAVARCVLDFEAQVVQVEASLQEALSLDKGAIHLDREC